MVFHLELISVSSITNNTNADFVKTLVGIINREVLPSVD